MPFQLAIFSVVSPHSIAMNRHGAPSMVISLVTGPFLLALLGARALSEALVQAGIASEELFRGERLPVLQTPPDALLQNDDVDAE